MLTGAWSGRLKENELIYVPCGTYPIVSGESDDSCILVFPNFSKVTAKDTTPSSINIGCMLGGKLYETPRSRPLEVVLQY